MTEAEQEYRELIKSLDTLYGKGMPKPDALRELCVKTAFKAAKLPPDDEWTPIIKDFCRIRIEILDFLILEKEMEEKCLEAGMKVDLVGKSLVRLHEHNMTLLHGDMDAIIALSTENSMDAMHNLARLRYVQAEHEHKRVEDIALSEKYTIDPELLHFYKNAWPLMTAKDQRALPDIRQQVEESG